MGLSANAMAGLGIGGNLAGQAFSGIFGHIAQKKENARQRDYETAMYERSKADNLAFWNMENMYNSPEMQMQRFKKAGLNPNLIYGQSNTASQLQAPAPNTSNSTKTNPPQLDVGSAMGSMYAIPAQQAQIDLARQNIITQQSQVEVNAATAGLKSVEQQLAQAKTDAERIRLQKLSDIYNAQLQNIFADTQLKSSNTHLADTRTEQAKATIEQILQNIKFDKQLKPEQIRKLQNEIANLSSRTNLSDVQKTYYSGKQFTERSGLLIQLIKALLTFGK